MPRTTAGGRTVARHAPRLKWWAWLTIAAVVIVAGTCGAVWVEHTEAVSPGPVSPTSGSYLTGDIVNVAWALENYRPGRGRVSLSVDGQAVPSSRLSLTSQGVQADLSLTEGSHCLVMDYRSHDLFCLHIRRSWVVTVDAVSPTLQVLSPSPGSVIRWKPAHLEALSDEVVSSAVLAVDGDPVPVTVAGETVSADVSVGTGSHQFALTVSDQAGKKSTVRWQATADFDNPAAKALVAPKVQAPSAVLIGMDSGRVIWSQNADVSRPMASTTKIMTALLTLNTLPLNQVVTVSARAASVGQQSVGLRAGDRLTVEQLLYGALIHSGNDAAFALAEACGGGSMEAFVARMNQEAKELGLSHTHYVNPDGLDAPGQYSSAADLAELARIAMQNAEFRRIVGTVYYKLLLPDTSTPVTFRNLNELLGTASWVTGVKTGSTSGAGYCLVASGTKDGASVISVVMGESSWTPTWSDSQALLEYGFSWERAAAQPIPAPAVTPVQVVAVAQPSVAVVKLPVPYHPGAELELIAKQGLQLTPAQAAKVQSSVSIPSTLTLPVKAGQVLGREEFAVGGKPVGWVDLVAANSIDGPTAWAKVAWNWHRLDAWLGHIF